MGSLIIKTLILIVSLFYTNITEESFLVEKDSSNSNKLPIIYSNRYNISVLGVEKFHPFDTKKFEKVINHLKKNMNITENQLIAPKKVTKEELLLVHSKNYLDSLENSLNIAKVVEIDTIKYLPYKILYSGLLEPMLYGTGGTILGVKVAKKYGWAINISGGYHHAKSDSGEGFCFFADIPIAINIFWKEQPNTKFLIIDLDAHHGNGVASVLGNHKNISILDIYNKDIYPHDDSTKKLVKYNIPIEPKTSDKKYLQLLEENLKRAIKNEKPDFIIYNAGTDIFEFDKLGNLSISEEGIIKRDETVFKHAFKSKIPILMVLSGGYNKKSGEIIGKSIENIIKKYLLFSL